MFEANKPRYVTKAISDELSADHLFFIVQYLYKQQKQLTDYLQVFEFYIEDGDQWLIQRQEVPDRETTIHVDLSEEEPMNRTVWAMDQQDYVMILFPEDY